MSEAPKSHRSRLHDLLREHPLLAPSARRQAALQRARWTIVVLDDVARVLADNDGADDGPAVQAAVRIADAASEATSAHRERIGTRAAMELIDCIKWAAEDVLDRGLSIEWAVTHLGSFAMSWPDLEPMVNQAACRSAVEAWIASERAMRQRGRRSGRTPEKWPKVHAALKASGLASGMKDGASVAKTWKRLHPSAK